MNTSVPFSPPPASQDALNIAFIAERAGIFASNPPERPDLTVNGQLKGPFSVVMRVVRGNTLCVFLYHQAALLLSVPLNTPGIAPTEPVRVAKTLADQAPFMLDILVRAVEETENRLNADHEENFDYTANLHPHYHEKIRTDLAFEQGIFGPT